MNIPIKEVKAFTDKASGGNPAGVVILNNTTLTNRQKQKLSTRAGYSETAFIEEIDENEFKIDFFTPAKQIVHCGHATVAGFGYMLSEGIINEGEHLMHTSDGGSNKVFVKNEKIYLEQRAPVYKELKETGVSMNDISNSIGVDFSKLSDEPMIVNTGNSFLLISLDSIKDLANLKPDFSLMSSISEQLDLVGYYVFNADNQIYSRMFAPWYGINEESATGMAAGPLACYLNEVKNIDNNLFHISQGYHMSSPSPSQLTVKLQEDLNNKIVSLKVGGSVFIE